VILDFSDELGRRHFEFCFVGFVLGGSMQQQKGMTVMRREVSLFEKLESISDLKPCGKKMVNGEPERQLKVAEGKAPLDLPLALDLDVHEFDLLYGYVAAVPWQSGTPMKHALEALDWLQRCQQETQRG
jgi:hypothetical protein